MIPLGVSLLLVTIAGADPSQAVEPTDAPRWPGELRIVAVGGSTLSREPYARAGGGLSWYPFPHDAWAGLDEVGAGLQLEAGLRNRPYAGLHAWLSYGRPRPGFWLAFDAGLAFAGGKGEAGSFAGLVSTLAATRFGYGPAALRLSGYITSRRAVVEAQYYSLSLEWAWLL